MRICIIAKYIYGIHNISGGLETHVADLISGISKTNEITIITSKHPENKKQINLGKIKVIFVNEIISRNPISRIKFFKSVAKKLKELNYGKKFDLMHIESDFGIGIFNYVNKEIPTITTVHGCLKNDFLASIKAKKYLTPIWAMIYPLYKSYEKSMLNNSDKIVCVSETLRKTLIKQYPKFKHKIITIHNGVNQKLYTYNKRLRLTMRKRYNIKNEFIMLFVGSLIMKKGLQNIIKVMPKIIFSNKDVKLFIAGSGVYKKDLENLVDKYNLRDQVVFLGRIDSKDLVNYYNMADLLVMPSLFIETFPYTILEAISCGLPVLASNVGGIPEIIKNKDFLFEKNNLKELRIKLNNVINLNLKDYSKKLLNIIKKYSVDYMIKKYIELYKGN